MIVDGDEFPAVVPLNVGGIQFTTSLETLRGTLFGGDSPRAVTSNAGGSSMLSGMFSGRIPTRRDPEGRYFIDRDGRHFHHILNYLRDGTFPASLTPSERVELAREASFHGLEALAVHLRGDLQRNKDPHSMESGIEIVSAPLSAAEAAELVLNGCLEEWPEFPQYVKSVLRKLLAVGGIEADEVDDIEAGAVDAPGPLLPQTPLGGVVLDEAAAASLQVNRLAVVQIELAHVDQNSKAWRWSERRAGVNSILRAKLLRCHLQRLGYACEIVPVLDKREISAYVLQVELPMPS